MNLPRTILAEAIEPALQMLPAGLKMRRPEQPRQRLSGLTINPTCAEVRPMADANSIRVPDARSSNGTPLFKNPCPDCGKHRLSDRRKLGKPCMSCANKRRSTHRLSNHPLYWLLKNVEARCKYPSASNYQYYGGRGITVCEEWSKDPAAFVEWALSNGYQPGLELDRKDVDGPYAPWNCRFIPHVDNSRSRRNAKCDVERARLVKAALASGKSVTEAAHAAGVPRMVAWHISKGNTWRDA